MIWDLFCLKTFWTYIRSEQTGKGVFRFAKKFFVKMKSNNAAKNKRTRKEDKTNSFKLALRYIFPTVFTEKWKTSTYYTSG